MRIAVYCPSFGQVGGIEVKTERLIEAFVRNGHEVTVLTRGERGTSRTEHGVPVVRLPHHQLPRRARHLARQARFLGQLPRVVLAMRHAISRARSDVVVTLAITSYAPYAIALATAAPVVLSLEGGEPGGRFTTNPRVLRWALRRASRVVACARSLAASARALAPEVAPILIPNGVDAERFADGPIHAHRGVYVAAVGRLVPQKGFDVLLEAFARALPAAPHADLLIAGDGSERRHLEEACDRLGLRGRVFFLGALAGNAVASLYRGAALVACPSRWEGMPLVCLEAMASGRAVVASAVDGIPDAVLDGETGLLVPRDDPEALAAALVALLRDPARRDALGARGRALTRERFTWPAVAAEYLGVLHEAANDTAKDHRPNGYEGPTPPTRLRDSRVVG
jgi:glycogen(starch) synthase